jgi:hypothetical protein
MKIYLNKYLIADLIEITEETLYLLAEEYKVNKGDFTIIKSKEEKRKAIENHIYSQCSKDKQAQDQVWTDNFRTKLVAMGVMGVEAKVVGGVKAFMGGVTIAEYLKNENVETMPLLEKLIRIGVRSEWVYQCILEGKKAIAEDREPVYAEYPNV